MGEICPENIEAAAEVIEPIFRNTAHIRDPALSQVVGRDVVLKLETFNPVRSFKGRGASFYMREVDPSQRVVTASAGNFGQAIAYAAAKRGIDVTVYCAKNANPTKIARMKDLGAHIMQVGADFDAAKEAAREDAGNEDRVLFVEDGGAPRITEGAGTIAVELAELDPDVILVPVGNGALATGIGCWIRARRPKTKVIGVSAAGAPAMAEAWRTGKPAATETAETIADGVAVRVPVPSVVPTFRDYIDDMLLVDDEGIRRALRVIRDTVGLILEPSAALGVAAMLQHPIPGGKVATIATGNNYSNELLHELTTAPAR